MLVSTVRLEELLDQAREEGVNSVIKAINYVSCTEIKGE
jgi:hypothetical protein